MTSLWAELKRRNVPRVGAAYSVAAWLVVEISSVVLPAFKAPDWLLQVVIVLALFGFPIALVGAWAFELTPDGLKRDDEIDGAGRTRERSSRLRYSVAIVILVVMAGALAIDRIVPTNDSLSGERSIAVLPFENMSGDIENEPFTNGMHNDLLTHISRISSIKAISRTSVLRYRNTTRSIPEIARELGVATILEGGVQRSEDRLRVNVQLIDAKTDRHLWVETYDRELTAANVFSIQTEIARSIAEVLRAKLSTDEERRLDHAPTQSLAAVDSYFIGKQLLEERNRDSLLAAVRFFEKVIELDPDFALAHSGLADAYMLLPEYTPAIDVQEAVERSEAAAERALELDPEQPEVLASMGWNRLIHHYDWPGAEQLLRRALEIEPNNAGALHWLSHVLSWQGRHREALENAERAAEVDPGSSLMAMNLSYIRSDARLFDESIAGSLVVTRQDPDYSEAHGNLWLTYLRAGRPVEASASLVDWAEQTRRDTDAAREVGTRFVRFAETGERQTLSNALVSRVEFGLEDLPQVYAFVGDAERTLDALQRAYEQRSGSRSVLSMKINPAYDFIRDDLRFTRLKSRVGLSGPR